MRQNRSVEVRRWMPASLLTAFLLHNLEEALTYARYRDQSQLLVRRLLYSVYTAPTSYAFYVLLTLVSVLSALAMTAAWRDPSSKAAPILVAGLAIVMLLNVIMPHLPAAILLGGYAPGAITAMLVNLPLSTIVLLRLYKGSA